MRIEKVTIARMCGTSRAVSAHGYCCYVTTATFNSFVTTRLDRQKRHGQVDRHDRPDPYDLA